MSPDEMARRYGGVALRMTRRRCRGRLRDEAESLAGLALAITVRGCKAGPGLWFECYLRKAVRSVVVNEARARKNRLPPPGLLKHDPAARRDPRDADARDAYERLAVGLTGRQRRVFDLVFVEGYTLRSAFKALGMSKSGGDRCYRAALAAVRETLRREE